MPVREIEGLDWSCHVCGATRPDDRIGVAKHRHIRPSGFEEVHNVRYCIDRSTCVATALLRDHTQLKFAEVLLDNDRLLRKLSRARYSRLLWFFPGFAFGFFISGWPWS